MIRHRTARLNEVSGRYSVMKDEFYLPAASDLAAQSLDDKQGRATEPFPPDKARETIALFAEGQKKAYTDYDALVASGLARELARINLPLSLYTEWYWQIDFNNLMHFLKLRLDPHAQREIRAYAEAMLSIAEKVCPVACASFRRHELEGINFSGPELAAINNLLSGKPSGLEGKAESRFRGKLAGKKS